MSSLTGTDNSSKNASARQQAQSGHSERQAELQPFEDLIEYAASYARENPGTAALWCFGVGFIVGWRLKPW